MADKKTRQVAIRRLVSTGTMTGQSGLLSALKEEGVGIDQSTLSRDLAELGIKKEGGRYIVPVAPYQGAVEYRGFVLSCEVCGPNLMVVRTGVGQAQAVAVHIDSKKDPSIVGTLAGDDTVFVATGTQRQQRFAQSRLEQWFGKSSGTR